MILNVEMILCFLRFENVLPSLKGRCCNEKEEYTLNTLGFVFLRLLIYIQPQKCLYVCGYICAVYVFYKILCMYSITVIYLTYSGLNFSDVFLFISSGKLFG